MHLRLFLAVSLLGIASLPAQNLATAAADSAHERRWTPAELEDLLAPIALHPDALIALILPAATNPSDVVLAARRLAANPNPATLDAEPWDDSVRGLARYPEIIKWMDEQLAWTKEVGQAFAAQPADAMNAIQRLRSKARATGALVDTPQQQVVVAEEEIRIVPARQDVIYVPRYDPRVVYVSRPTYYSGSFFTFGVGYPVGHWLAYDCDWRRHTVWIVAPPHRARVWYGHRDWRHHRYPDRRDDCWYTWQPRRPHSKPRFDGDRDRPHDRYTHGPSDRHPGRDFDRDDYRNRRDYDWNRKRRDHPHDEPVNEPGGRRVSGDRRDWDRSRVVTQPTPLPGGPTPTISPPVAPVAPVGPVTDLTPRTPPTAPRVLPNGRRLPGEQREPISRVQLPNGRYISAPQPMPTPTPAPASAATYAPPRETRAPGFQRPEMSRVETPRPQPRVDSSRPEPAPRPARAETRSADRGSDNGRSQTERLLD
jgi:hypothetical protein